MRNKISLRALKKVLLYNSETGVFTWQVRRSGVTVGMIAGVRGKYIRIKIDGVTYSGACLAWLWMTGRWPTSEVDHRDLDKHNNAWSNLRKATRAQNMQNCPCWKKQKTSQYKGVYWKKDAGKWEANIRVDGRQRYLGRYVVESDAHKAYAVAANKYFGEFARAA